MSRKLAIVIGNTDYEDATLSGLTSPGADVTVLAAVLRDPQIGGFDEVEALVNQPAAAIRRAISAFFVGRRQDDLLLLYFSGHGIRDDRGQLFLAAKDTEHSLLRGTAIPAGFITDEMDNSRSRRQVLVLDCCHSGAFSSGMKGVSGESVGTAAAFEGTGSGRVVLTATDSTQYAWEGDRVIGQAENSVFTHYLIQGLRTGQADSDGDGRITLDELYNYVYEHVVDETPLQTPGKWSYGQQGEIVIARNPRPVIRAVALPADLQQTIDDPRPWVREGAAQELERILHSGSAGMVLSARAALQRLAEDDSRRVSAEAARILAKLDAAEPAKPDLMATLPEPDHTAAGDVPSGAKAAAPEAGGAPAAAAPVTGAPEVGGAEVAAPVPVKPELHKTVPAAPASREGLETGRAVWWKSPLVTITTLGWAVGFFLSFAIYQTYSSPLVGGFTGAVIGQFIGLALNQSRISITWKQLLVLTLGWGVALWLFWGSESPLVHLFDYLSYNDRSPWLGAISGLVGGLATALALQWNRTGLRWRRVVLITLGWIVAGYAGLAIFNIGYNEITSGIFLDLYAMLFGGVSGVIGSLVMAWQLREEP